MLNEMEELVSEVPRDRHAFQKNQRRMYDCKTLQSVSAVPCAKYSAKVVVSGRREKPHF